MAEGIDGDMRFAPLAAFVPVVPRPGAALRRRLDGAAVEDDGPRVGHPPVRFPQQHAQIVRHRREDASRQPPPCLLVDRLPRWEVGGQQAPRGSSTHDPAQGVEDLAQVMAALGGIFAHQGQIGDHKGPFLITHIGRIRLAGDRRCVHPPSLPSP